MILRLYYPSLIKLKNILLIISPSLARSFLLKLYSPSHAAFLPPTVALIEPTPRHRMNRKYLIQESKKI
jgi:hypothetical protein